MNTVTTIIKHISRNVIVKFLTFLLILGCVGGAAYMVNDTALQIVQITNLRNGELLYQFDSDLEHSSWLYQQMNHALYELDDVINYQVSPSDVNLNDFLGDYYIRRGDTVVTNNENLLALYENHTLIEDSERYLIAKPDEWENNFPVYSNPSAILRGRDDAQDRSDTDGEDISSDSSDSSVSEMPETDILLLRVTPAQLEPYQAIWKEQQQVWFNLIQRVLYLVVVALLAFLFLLFVTGRVPADENVHLVAIDHLPLELNFFLLLLAAGIGIGCYIGVLFINLDSSDGSEWAFLSMPSIALLVAMAALVIELLLSQVRNFKNHTYVARSLILRMGSRGIGWLWDKLKRLVQWSWAKLKRLIRWSWTKIKRLGGWSRKTAKNVGQGMANIGGKVRQSVQENRAKYSLYRAFFGTYQDKNVFLLFVAYSVGLFILAACTGGLLVGSEGSFLFFLLLAGLLGLQGLNFLKKRLPGFGDIVTGVHRMREGELTYKIDAPALPEGVMRTLADDINSLGDGMQTALQDAIRAERLKSELITNVSHDLKTPLTSILNYADLLCQEALSPEEANDYAQIIYQKGLRLKNLTSDLFDISKVQSGAETIQPERLDVVTLVQQTLAEQDTAITASGLLFKVTMPDHPVIIWADGKKMSRVLENLVNNCLKYALSGTRVFLMVWEPGNHTMTLEIKNIANYEMDFAADEITDRFVRGDSSRSTDGSGLGLAIAKSYTVACGGILNVETDGDLFKVKIVFPLCDG